MIIKPYRGREADIAALEALLSHPRASGQIRDRIGQEIRRVRAGAKGEKEAAYEIDFHHQASSNWAVVHDVRIEYQGRVAQIDHLVINRFLDVWVCESKHFADGVAVNEHGEFTAFYGRQPFGVPSPLEQNRRHIAVLQSVFGSIVPLPSRLGIPIRPRLHSVVLVSKNARITRPKAKIDGIDSVIKNDQFRQLIERRIDEESGVSTLLSIGKMIGTDTLEEFSRQVAALHRPIEFNWAAKFGFSEADARASQPSAEPALARVQQASLPAANEPADALAANVYEPARDGKPGFADDPHAGRLSTSKLAAKLGLRTARDALDRLTAAGYLHLEGGRHVLTPKAAQAGAVFVEKSRYGPYFLWPETIQL